MAVFTHPLYRRQSLEEIVALLDSYAVSKNGFVPGDEPLRSLPDTYYAPWDQLISNLPLHMKQNTLRSAIHDLPQLSTDKLQTEPEWQRAYMILTFLAHGYIWGGDKPAEVLPPAITVPLLQVSDHFELPPVATYASLNLWNFSCAGTDFTNADSLTALHTFTATQDESWFYTLSAAMEAHCAYVIPLMVQAMQAVPDRDYATITRGLQEMVIAIGKMSMQIGRMPERCDPIVFFRGFRPYLAGSMNMGDAGLPRGVFYDEGDGKGSWRQLRGGSNGQSSLIQFLDVVLGVEHHSEGEKLDSSIKRKEEAPKKKEGGALTFQEEVRYYMPGSHRRFLEDVARLPSVRELALQVSDDAAHVQMQRMYQAAITAMSEFRNKHLQIVTRYIILPSRKQAAGGAALNLASASAESGTRAETELTGTGGTSLIPFLKQTRDETFQCGRLDG